MTVSINNISENTVKIEEAGRDRQRKPIWAFYPPSEMRGCQSQPETCRT